MSILQNQIVINVKSAPIKLLGEIAKKTSLNLSLPGKEFLGMIGNLICEKVVTLGFIKLKNFCILKQLLRD